MISEDALNLVYKSFYSIYENRDKDFANARMVRNFLELIHRVQARRLSTKNISSKSDDQLKTINTEDVRAALSLYLSQNTEDENYIPDKVQTNIVKKTSLWQKLSQSINLQRGNKNIALNKELQQILISSENNSSTFKRWGLIFLTIAVISFAYYLQNKSNENSELIPLINYKQITVSELEELKGQYSGYFYSAFGKSKAAIEITEYQNKNKLLKAYLDVYSGALKSKFSEQRQIIFGLDSTYHLASDNYFPASIKTDAEGIIYLVSRNSSPSFSFIKLQDD